MSGQLELGNGSMEARLGQVADEFTDRVNRGERPEVEDYARRYPEMADVLRQVLPALQVMRPGSAPVAPGGAEVGGAVLVSGCLGDFRLIREVGRGGMGVVYEAEQISLGRRVALKVLPFAAMMDPRQRQRFQNEARAAACLDHPHVVKVHAVGSERGVHFYAMQFIDGLTLADLVARQRQPGTNPAAGPGAPPEPTGAYAPGPADPQDRTAGGAQAATEPSPRDRAYFRRVAEWGAQAAEALEHAHGLGVVHRDVKPANLMVDGRGKLWVADFGLARTAADSGLTVTGDLVGTLRYMSPEQALARHGLVDHRTDVYSLGATLYELLTLRPPFEGADRQELLRQVAFEEPPPPRRLAPAVPAELEPIVLKCLEKAPSDRYGTAQEVADDLRRFLEDRPTHARRPTALKRVAKWAGRHRRAVTAAAAALVLTSVGLAVATVLIALQRDEALRQRQRAEARSRLAWQAAEDMYTQVAERILADQPRMELVHREFLEKALTIYQEFLQEDGTDPKVRYQTAKAYQRLGNVLDKLEGFDEAEKADRRAIALLEGLAAEFPGEALYRYELTLSLRYLGFILADTGRPHEAKEAHQKAVALAEGLVSELPQEPRYRDLLAGQKNGLADMLHCLGEEEQAEACYRQARCSHEELARRFPQESHYLKAVANDELYLGFFLQNTGRNELAVEMHHQALARLRLAPEADAKTPHWQKLVGQNHLGLGNAFLASGRLSEAEKAFRDALAVFAGLARDFPNVHDHPRMLVDSRRGLGDVLWQAGRLREAEVAYRGALATLEELVRDYPSSAQHNKELVLFLTTCRGARFRDPSRAVRLARKATELAPRDGQCWTTLGLAHYRAGDPAAAVAVLERSMPGRISDDGLNCFILAMAHERLGAREKARGWYDEGTRWQRDHKRYSLELVSFRAEAAALLGIQCAPNTKGKEVVPK